MKKLFLSIFLIIILEFVSSSQESVPYSLRNFFDNYISGMNNFYGQEMFERNFRFGDYFLNVKDTLYWPDNYNLHDYFFKHRLGPEEAYSQFLTFRNKSSANFEYYMSQLGNIQYIKSRPKRFYEKYRLRVTEDHIFNSIDFFGGKDSIVSFTNYFDVVSWFNPSSNQYSYEYRINKIYEKKLSSWLTPQMLRLKLDYYMPSFSEKIPYLSESNGIGTGISANWLLGGNGYNNYSFISGLSLSTFRFNLEDGSFLLSDNNLMDRDNYPFTLKSELAGLHQSLSITSIQLPVHFGITKYLRNGKFSTALSGGINLHFPLTADLSNKDGEVTFTGKYKFDFAKDSILLEKLDSYNFKTFSVKEMKSELPKLNKAFISAEISGEFNWYIRNNWVAGFNLGYLKSLTPFYSESTQRLAYNVVESEGNDTFEPSMNSFLTLKERNKISALKFGIALTYLIEKPVIPHGKVGYRDKDISKIIREEMVISSGSYTQQSDQKNLFISFTDSVLSRSLFSQKVPYRYVGPSPKYYKQGSLSSSSRKGNKLTFQVPASNAGSKLFIEEPYGYNISIDSSFVPKSGGLYGEIKVINSENLWKGKDNQCNLNLSFTRLSPMHICLINYKYSFDDFEVHRDKILTQLKKDVENFGKKGADFVVYFISDQPEAVEIRNGNLTEEILERLDVKFKNTDDVLTDVEGLKGYFSENKINPRRKIILTLYTSAEFVDFGKKSVEEFAKTMNIDSDYLDYSTYLHSYGKSPAIDADKSVNFLRKIGVFNE